MLKTISLIVLFLLIALLAYTATRPGSFRIQRSLGIHAFVAKLIGLFVDMDKLVGKDFEAGLASLKAAAEK